MIELQNKDYLLALGAIPVFIVLFWVMMAWRKRAIKRFGNKSLVLQLIPHYPRYKHQAKFIFLILALGLLIVGIANPQIGTKLEKVKRKGVDVVIAIDVSKSMLAEDLKPSRLVRAKRFVSKLVDEFQNDRVAIVVFAGNAYLQMPLTIDYAAAKMYLNNIRTEMVPTQGTAIGEAIRMANRSFEMGEKKYKMLIIITDGENHDEDAITMAKEVSEEGGVIHTIGVGTTKGAPIPVYSNNIQVDYKKDKQGSIVLSKLNDNILKQIADACNGNYFPLSGGQDEIEAIMNKIKSMEKKEFEERVFTEYESKFQYFLAGALLFLLLEFFISERKRTWLSDWLAPGNK